MDNFWSTFSDILLVLLGLVCLPLLIIVGLLVVCSGCGFSELK